MSASDPSSPPLRTLAFGTLQEGVWGAGWFPGGGRPGGLVVCAGEDVHAHEAVLEPDPEQRLWRVRADGAELVVTPDGDAVALAEHDDAPAGFEQLCGVTGTLMREQGTLDLEGPGRVGDCAPPGELERLDSVREVSAWFAPGEAVAVLALRPRKHRGHEHDAIGGAVVSAEPFTVVEPRLSTTYTAAGRPARVNLELWGDDPEQYPRRVAGEATGAGAHWRAGGWELTAELLRCHSRGQDGAGVYLLARPASR